MKRMLTVAALALLVGGALEDAVPLAAGDGKLRRPARRQAPQPARHRRLGRVVLPADLVVEDVAGEVDRQEAAPKPA